MDSVNGRTGDVVLTLTDLDGDTDHRVVTDAQITDWNGKQDAGNYATNTALIESLAKKQDSGDYVTTADLAGKLDKAPIGEATPDDTQEVHLTPGGKLMTKPAGGGGVSITLTTTTASGATVTTTDGVTTLTQEAPAGTAVFSLPNAGKWTATAEKNGETLGPGTISVKDNYPLALASKILNDNSWEIIHSIALSDQGDNYWDVGDT